jgi:hypothetical protein
VSSPLDDRIRTALDRIRVSLSGQLEADLTASATDILRAVSDEQRQAIFEATERAAADVRRDAEQQLALVRGEFDGEREALQRAAASEVADVQRTLGDVRERLEAAQQNLHEAQAARDSLAQEKDSLTEQRDALEHQHRSLEQQRDALEHQRQLLVQQRDALEQQRSSLELERSELQQQIARLQQSEADGQQRLERALDDAHREAELARYDSEAVARELEEVRTRLTQSTRLAAALRSLNEASSLGEILEYLAQSACQEASRTAVFLVSGVRLRGWRALGFGVNDPIVGSDFEPGADVIGQAARSGMGQRHRNGDSTRLPDFVADSTLRDAIALPVQVGGSVIAVLYADAARTDKAEDPDWLDRIGAMAKHAGRALEAMTVRQAAAMSMPRSAGKTTSQPGRGGRSVEME